MSWCPFSIRLGLVVVAVYWLWCSEDHGNRQSGLKRCDEDCLQSVLLWVTYWSSDISMRSGHRSSTPPKSKTRRPRRRGSNVLGRRTGLLSTEAKVWGIMPKTAWHWGTDSNVANDPFRAPGSTPSYVCLPHSWGSAGGDCLLPGSCRTNTDHKKSAGKNGESLGEFKFCCLGKHCNGTKRLWWDSFT
jgi:hypothetical protein